jgi:ABC-2 type transport system ATP-binding protein
MNEILRLHNLSKAFGRKGVLRNFNLALEKGKVYGLLGKNGEGKTTLIRIIMGIIPSDSGEMFYKGQKIKFNDSSYKKEIGYIPEEAFFFRWMRISELLAFNSAFYPAWNAKKAEDYLERFSLPWAAKIGQLSRGMKLKLGLAVALAAKPELLILDDPTSGIDVPTRQDFLKDIIAELSDAGTTILFSTHLVHELERIVERLGILGGGNLILDEDYQRVKSLTQRIRLTFEGPVPEKWGFDGILQEKQGPHRCELTVYPWDEDKEKRLRALGPATLEKESLALEEIFVSFISSGAPNEKRNRGRN